MLKLNRALILASILALVAACGQQGAPAATETAESGDPAAPGLDAPSLNGAPGATAAGAPAALPSIEPGVYRNGNFAMRVEQASLLNTSNPSQQVILHSNLTITYFNTGSEPVAFILLDPWESMNMVLDNGLRLEARRNENQGIALCGTNQLAQCRVASADRYTQLAPGTSVSVNYHLINVFGRENPAVPTIPSIATGNLVINAHVIEGGSDRSVQASLLNTPLRNGVQL